MSLIPFIGLLASILVRCVSTSYNKSVLDMNLLPKDWPLFVSLLSGYLCQNGSRVIRQGYPKYGFDPDCFSCDCDKNCSLKGTCCPTIGPDNETVSYEIPKSSPNSYLNDIYTRVDYINPLFSSYYYLTVVQCPLSWNDTEVKQKCEQRQEDSFDSIIPYTYLNLGLVFPNYFCLVCHGLVPHSNKSDDSDIVRQDRLRNSCNLQAWNIHIMCKHQTNLIKFLHFDRFQIYKRARSLSECQSTASPNDARYISADYIGSRDPRSTNKGPPCPSEASETLKELCHTLPDIMAFRVDTSKNIFCYLCHGGKVKLRKSYDLSNDDRLWKWIPFSVTTQVNGNDTYARNITVCLPNQWGNDKDQCILATCPAGKVFVNEDKCKSVYGDIVLRTYRFNVTLVVQGTITNEWFEELVNAIKERFGPDGTYNEKALLKSCFLDDDHTIYKQEIHIFGNLWGKYSVLKDDFEGEMIDILTDDSWDVEIMNDENVPQVIRLRPACLGAGVCGIYRNQSKDKNCFQYKKTDYIPSYSLRHSDTTKSLACPYVTVNLATNPIVVDNNIVFTIGLRNQSIQVIWNPNISIVDNEVRVCLDFLKDLILHLPNSSSEFIHFPKYNLRSTLLTISYFMDIVCIATSCICLMASISTYMLFPSLRNLPGLNNLCLCLSLLTAQVSLLVTSLLGSRGLLTETHCLVHAMVLHYSWIASFVWMNTCCIHMYRIFTGHYLESHKRQFLWYCIYSFGFPFFVVVTLITITTVTTTGKSFGYGSDVCFLDTKTSSLIIILGLLAPLAITALINVILFILTIRQIVTVTKMQLQHKSTHGVFTYLKLSTVTGAFCFFAAASVQFESPIMFLISSLFAALQGVFIFTSFIVNKRILELYKDLIVFRKRKNSQSQSTTNKIKAINSIKESD